MKNINDVKFLSCINYTDSEKNIWPKQNQQFESSRSKNKKHKTLGSKTVEDIFSLVESVET